MRGKGGKGKDKGNGGMRLSELYNYFCRKSLNFESSIQCILMVLIFS